MEKLNIDTMIIAIDPGVGGGFAWGEFTSMQTMAMPKKVKIRDGKIQGTKKGKAKKEVDEDFVLKFLEDKKEKYPDVKVVIEHQQLRHGDSDGFRQFRMQSLLNNYQIILSFCKALQITVEPIQAVMWQKKHRPLPKDYAEKKKALYAIAKRKYLRLKPTTGTCDAILILEHALIHQQYE
jgi:hypothetical protein